MIRIFLLITIFFISIFSKAQQPIELKLSERGEVVVWVNIEELRKIENIASFSFDRKTNDNTRVYLNTKQYKYFIKKNIAFVPAQTPSELNEAKMANSLSEFIEWDAYPTYSIYVEFMENLAKKYPNYCKLDTIGYSVNNRLILVLKISDNVNETEDEPELFYTSSMHGDELTGYYLMQRLAQYLLENKDTGLVKELVENVQIFINPLANPDGAYYSGNSTVNGAIRYNANFVDLNRNFPDIEEGDHPDGNAWQPENIGMMNFMKAHSFTLSMNFHGGTEVMNYPWDTFGQRHADDNWYQLISQQYVDTVHAYDNTYFTELNNGITNGFDWYTISGGRMDYMNYFLKGREVCCELSGAKLPAAENLPYYWEANYKSLLNYMQHCLFGISGYVTDTLGNAVKAKVTVVSHDADNSFIYATESGKYYRLIKEGIYSLQFEANGFPSLLVEKVEVLDGELTELDVVMKGVVSINNKDDVSYRIYPNPAQLFFTLDISEVKNGKLIVFNALGQPVIRRILDSPRQTIDVSNLSTGMYTILIQLGQNTTSKKLIVTH